MGGIMRELIRGVHQFRETVFSQERELFERLCGGQNPATLFVSCADSRVDPGLITQTAPGELFVLRNAGNLVPPYGASNGGEGATIEFAVAKLGVRDVVVCGHTKCGAIQGLLNLPSLQELPLVAAWLTHAETTRRIVAENYAELSGDALLAAAVQEHVLVQIENLQTHPAVAVRLHRGDLNLHAWVYELESGSVLAYSGREGRFLPIEKA
jgi:carbonic anhydrase